MSTTPFQPALPAEIAPSEQELNYIDESPPALFPENQNSNFGFIHRKVFSDQMAKVAMLMDTLYAEKFVDSSSAYLDEHEIEVGLPPNPTGISVIQRRTNIKARLRKGRFTRTRRREIVEEFILATFGQSIQLLPEGVALVSAGVPLFSDPAPVTTLYNIVENITNFSYDVRIKNTVTVDTPALTREFKRLTPSGISFTISYVADPFA
jgi:hypothetical protein